MLTPYMHRLEHECLVREMMMDLLSAADSEPVPFDTNILECIRKNAALVVLLQLRISAPTS